LIEITQQRARDLQRVGEELVLEPPRAIHARAALENLHRGLRHQPQQVAGFEADLLHPKVARCVTGHGAEPSTKVTGELPGLVKTHEILAEVEDVYRHTLGSLTRNQERVLLLQHAAARGPGDHHVVTLVDGTAELFYVEASAPCRPGDIASIE